jgi:sulfatase modifying factor 1
MLELPKVPATVASIMKASYYKTLLLVLMCLCLFGCSKPGEPTESAPPKGESFSIPDINLDMLWCKPGTFMMGSPKDEMGHLKNETQHEVTLTKGFYLGKYEVTQEQWEKVMGSNPSVWDKGTTLPVEMVSWDSAINFCQKLTQMEKAAGRLPEGWAYTLPTEAQWEYACRAGTTTAYSFGDEITPKQANYDENVDKTTPVDTYPANAWGFHDMHGNVWEQCLDWYGDYPDGSASDPVGPSGGSIRVYRGGSWYDFGRYMRSAFRYRYTPGFRRSTLGLRLSLQTEKTE